MADSVDRHLQELPAHATWRSEQEKQRSIGMLVSTSLSIVFMAAALLLPVPYAITSPGPTVNVLGDIDDKPLLGVSGTQTYPAEETLSLVTIRVSGGPSGRTSMGALVGGLLSDEEVVQPVRALYPRNTTSEQVDQRGAQEMSASQAQATAAALRHLDRPVGSKVIVSTVSEGSGASGVLEPDDVLVQIGETTIESLEDVKTAGEELREGEAAPVVVNRGGADKTLEVTPTLTDGVPRLGIMIKEDYDFDIDVSFELQDIGGPSAGMIFSLALLERLTPEQLIAKNTAGTGTMTADGKVGAIGGVHLKMISARRAGAEWFLAPAANCSGVTGKIPAGLNVVAVDTLDTAVSALEDISAGRTSDLPSCADQPSS